MGKAQKWILLANGLDHSNLRNKIAYDFAQNVGLAYSPDSRWVDLYLNGEYAGLYLLCERVEVHTQRVDISHPDSFLISSEFDFRLKEQNYPYFTTGTQLAMRIHYPAAVTENVQRALTEKWQSVENAILADDGIDPVTGKHWLDLIDLDSWAKKYLFEEVFANVDAYFISQYYYFDGSDPSGKVYSGPVWDSDATMGNQVTCQVDNPYAIFAGRPSYRWGIDTPLIYTLSQKEAFRNRLAELYESEFLPQLETLFADGINAYAAEIERAAAMNQIRWDIVEDVFAHRDDIVAYMHERTAFLYDMWVTGTKYYQVLVDPGNGTMYIHLAVPAGGCLTELPEYQDTKSAVFLGNWYDSDTDEPFDITKPITEDIRIYATWKNNGSNKLDTVSKLLPLGVIAFAFVIVFATDVIRRKKGG